MTKSTIALVALAAAALAAAGCWRSFLADDGPSCPDDAHECGLEGERSCHDGLPKECVADPDGCRRWHYDELPCGDGETCVEGDCVDDGCPTDCTLDELRCDANNVVQCALVGDCPEWVFVTPCPAGQTCHEGGCVDDDCPGDCILDDRRCAGADLEVCVDADGCAAWVVEPCGEGQVCDDSNGVPECVAECPDPCDPALGPLCVQFLGVWLWSDCQASTDGACPTESSGECAAGQLCEVGCGDSPPCFDPCPSVDDAICVNATERRICDTPYPSVCSPRWGDPTPCRTASDVCLGGLCIPRGDERLDCFPAGARRCGLDGAVERCREDGSGYVWEFERRCDPDEECSAGSCEEL
jgi:hypothetical protein